MKTEAIFERRPGFVLQNLSKNLHVETVHGGPKKKATTKLSKYRIKSYHSLPMGLIYSPN